MSLEKFLEVLAKTPRYWQVTTDGRLRNERGLCPLQATGYMQLDLEAVIWAADGIVGHDPILRAQLLEACGLS